MREYPETIDNAWDVLYREYPEIYDTFTSFPYRPGVLEVVQRRFDVRGKVILDIGAGGGQSAIPLAQRAQHVLALEPEAAMRAIGQRTANEQGARNVSFIQGSADAIPLEDDSVDVAIAVTAPLLEGEALRVVRTPGLVLALDVCPGWYGGELNPILQHPTPEVDETSLRLRERFAFSFEDFDTVQDYGTSENIIRTYGFIFGPRAIRHLKETGQTTIRWRFRMHYRHT